MREESKSHLGIAYLYTTIAAIFAIVTYLQLLFYNPIDKYYMKAFVLLFGTYAAIWFVLFKLNKKRNQSLSTIFKDCTARKTMGVILLKSGLISSFLYIPSSINAVSLIIKDEIDLSVIPSIICVLLFICQILLGLYLLKCKLKTDEMCKSESVIGIAFLYTFITFIFSLVEKLSQAIISCNSLDEYFLLRFATYVTILLVLYILNKKQSQSFVAIFNNNTIRKATGVLVLIEGLISLSIKINSVIDTIWLRGIIRDDVLHFVQSITLSIVGFIIIAIQILLGIYLLRSNKEKTAKHNIAE